MTRVLARKRYAIPGKISNASVTCLCHLDKQATTACTPAFESRIVAEIERRRLEIGTIDGTVSLSEDCRRNRCSGPTAPAMLGIPTVLATNVGSGAAAWVVARQLAICNQIKDFIVRITL